MDFLHNLCKKPTLCCVYIYFSTGYGHVHGHGHGHGHGHVHVHVHVHNHLGSKKLNIGNHSITTQSIITAHL